tara:strand:- start:2093 stop:2413 length:321 start_codon:yes stop_codon:yes gene_type:complete
MIRIIKLSFIIFFFSTIHTKAKDVYLSCESTTKFRTSFIINDEKKILILDGIEREVVNWTKEFITFWKSQTMKEISEPRNFKPDTLDRIAGSYGSYNCKVVKKTLF